MRGMREVSIEGRDIQEVIKRGIMKKSKGTVGGREVEEMRSSSLAKRTLWFENEEEEALVVIISVSELL